MRSVVIGSDAAKASPSISSKRRTRRCATVHDEFPLYLRAEAFVAETRAKLAQAVAAPNAARCEAGFRDVWIYTKIAGEKLDELPCTTTALKRRRDEMKRQLDAIEAEAAQEAFSLSERESRDNLVEVDFVARRRAGAR